MDHITYPHFNQCQQTLAMANEMAATDSQCIVVNNPTFASPVGHPFPTTTNLNQNHIPNSPPQIMQKKKRSINPQADENFVKALDAVRYGGIGFCKAARMYGVNNRTLWLEYKKRGYPNFRLSIKNRNSKQETVPIAETNESEAQTDQQPEQQQQLASTVTKQEGDSVVCATNHPVALISSAYLEGRHVDLSPVLQRQRYLESAIVNPQHSLAFPGINFEQV